MSFIMREGGKTMNLDWPTIGITTLISLPVAFLVGLSVNSTSDWWKFWKKRKANRIKITSPRSGAILGDVKYLSPGRCFRVTGTLGFLPEGHRIWLLVQPRGKKGYWPQGFEGVMYNPDAGEWWGHIYEPAGKSHITIVAVVAPQSSQMIFEYYQKHGRATGWDPIDEIPDECINSQRVEAQTP
jgi:hypothetical protein